MGGGGNDTFQDGYGADTLAEDNGSDVFHMGSWLRAEDYRADSVIRGAGCDPVDYGDADYGVIIDLQAQSSNSGAARGDRISGVERIEGTDYDDELYGDLGSNALHGGSGDDVIRSRDGSDLLIGGSGADGVAGGGGSDTFVLERDDGHTPTYWPHDVFKDFMRGTDKLYVSEAECDAAQRVVAGPERLPARPRLTGDRLPEGPASAGPFQRAHGFADTDRDGRGALGTGRRRRGFPLG